MSLFDELQKKVVIVAEIGKNFIQEEKVEQPAVYLERVKELVKTAKDAGADAVKFQTHHAEDEVLNIAFDSPHFKGKNRYEWVSRNEAATPLDDFWRPLKAYCESIGIIFFSTPMSRGAAQKLQQIDTPFWKVASSDILDFPMLDFMASTGKSIIIPTGMSTLQDVELSVAFLCKKKAHFVLMHAISRYPYPAEDSNLLTIAFLQKRFPAIPIGFSQNSPWIEPAIASIALGARIVEQHFTFDRALWGPDHKVSMVPEEFKEMAHGIRALEKDIDKQREYLMRPEIQKFLGKEEKFLQEGEEPFRSIFRKALMASRDLSPGTHLAAEDIYAMRPQQFAGGLPSEQYEQILGKKLLKPLKKFDPITENVLTS
ncbi:MAG: hypothetical protein G01um101466_246 [Parcubacteria group bacterium Gr01-1014_66]|nr:MAG: hypothetical protein G01um101466_246 [Parcubacteria group bacterium Gr01-1014_66]